MIVEHSIAAISRWQLPCAWAAIALLVFLGCERRSQPIIDAESSQDVEAEVEAPPAPSTVAQPDDGVEIQRESWPNGSPKSEKRVKRIHGAFIDHGPWTLWHENGQVQATGRYIDGRLDGIYQEWHDNGQLRASGHYSKGDKEDVFTLWNLDGAKTHEWHYSANKQHGMRTIWYPDGRMKSQVEFIDGRMHGTLIEWEEDGQIIKEVNYVNGTLSP